MDRLIDKAAAVDLWLDPDTMRARIHNASDTDLPVLYEAFSAIANRAWQARCAVVAELQSRSHYGSRSTEAIAKTLDISPRTVQYQARVGAMLTDPECAGACVILSQSSWWKIASEADDPKAAILLAADRKAADPNYSTRQFEATVRDHAELTVTRIILVCDGTPADRKAAARLRRQYNAIVDVCDDDGQLFAISEPPLAIDMAPSGGRM